ncbi:effector-associated domain EAD1-containing protein [Amycolatopsis sp. NPDC048633]|uniref:effector-associated domain EAD1-containing protein n=1 Tax=Amycolatopsis sp. NPDC048633 TaxID=3157095 RepID=UPI0033E002CC
MAPTEGLRSGRDDESDPGASGSGRPVPPEQDIALSAEELDELLVAFIGAFRIRAAAERAVRRLGFPVAALPGFDNPSDFWSNIFLEVENGILDTTAANWELLMCGLRVYPRNETFRRLAVRYGLVQDASPQAVPEPPAVPAPLAARPADVAGGPAPEARQAGHELPSVGDTCHVIVRAGSEDARDDAYKVLAGLGLDPAEEWSTANAVSFRLSSADAGAVRRLLDATTLGWTLVPPGVPDYLIARLYIDGPDGRRFRIEDAPAQQTMGHIASELIHTQYPGDFAGRRQAVVDHVDDRGTRRRVRGEDTLHDAGIRDGDQLRVGFQATAGSNPLDRQDAIFRVRKQMRDYAAAHPGFEVRVDSDLLPMAYLISFSAPSWAPPAEPGGPVRRTDRHEVEIELGPEFPITPPRVVWRSPIFHPNVAPMYDTPERRVAKEMRGTVCLGLLQTSYQPAMSFGELCQILVDMAGYRNYSLVERVEHPDGRVELLPNVYDANARAWVDANPDRIREIGGIDPRTLSGGEPGDRTEPHYPNVIFRQDAESI